MNNSDLKPLVLWENTKKKFSKIGLKMGIPLPSAVNILFFVMGLLCGRATLLGILRPFGGAFFAAIFSGKFTYIYMIGAIVGQVWAGAPLYETGKYIFAMTFYALVTEKLPYSSKRKSVVRGGMFAFALALSGLCFLFASTKGFTYTTLYDLMLLFLECIVAFCATAGFHKAIPIIESMKLSYSFSSLEEISLVSLFGCALWGAKDISSIGFVNIADVICILIVIIFAVRLGSGRGVIAGLTMGLVSALGSGRVDISCVSYAFSALAASLAGAFGAIPGCSAFILANALITALANGSTEVLINLYDIFLACVLYSIIPERVLLRITSFGSRDEKDRLCEDERHYSEYVLLNAQSAVNALAKRMGKLQEGRKTKNEADKRFFERIARKSCSGCGMRKVCWARDAQKTAASLSKALTDFGDTGKLKSELLPPNCLRPKELREAFLSSAEIYRIECMWQGKLEEMQEVSQKQMEAFSDILDAARNALAYSKSFDRALADDIERKMADAQIKCGDVVVMRDEDFAPTVMLHLENCGRFSLCDKGAAEIVSAACGKEMIRAGKKDCRNCNIKYVPSPPARATFAVAGQSRDKKKLSGDSVRFRVIDKSLYAAVLCDGMGFGEKAAFEARGAAETLLDLIEAGVDGEAAMRIANSLLIPYGEATFSAADLCLYDAINQTVKIIKCGGAASFTKSGERVDALYSKNMPLGSVVKNQVETYNLSAKSGDIIVMISDGVLEGSKESALKDTWLIDELESFTGNDPETLADKIAQKAIERCGNNPRDDITVLAAYIE